MTFQSDVFQSNAFEQCEIVSFKPNVKGLQIKPNVKGLQIKPNIKGREQ